MEKPGFSPERPPAALQPARRLSWLASERARLCLSLTTQSGLVELSPLHVCMHASQQRAGAAFHENYMFFLQFVCKL